MKRIKKIKFKKIFILFIPLVILLCVESFTFAKYVIEKVSNYFVSSKNFYFTSNILKANKPHYEVNNWSGIGEFTISFDLSSKKNNYIATDYDITYNANVVCPSDVICNIDKSSGTIYSASHTDTVTVTVSPTRLYTEGEKIIIELNAESQSPYKKKISAVFEYIVGKLGVTYEVEDEVNRTYLLLKVTNAINYCTVTEAFGTHQVGDVLDSSDYMHLSDTNKQKCISQNVKVEFDPNVIYLDTVNQILNRATYSSIQIGGTSYINKLEYSIGPLSTIDVKFYKKNSAVKYTYQAMENSNTMSVEISSPE